MDFGWFDDLKTRVTQTVDQTTKDVKGYLDNRWVEPLVKIGTAPTGNLSAEQLAAGSRGAPSPQGQAVVAPVSASSMMQYLPIIIGVAVIAAFAMKRK